MTSVDSDEEFKFPKTLQEFGYKFNEFGRLEDISTGKGFEYDVTENHVYNQQRYEALGEIINDYVYDLLTEAGLKKLAVPLDAGENEHTTNIFHSDDAFTKEKLIVLIHGSGVVRAGQWARRLIINDNLRSGTQLPFIKRAIGLNYGVLVLNTNDNSREVGEKTESIRGSETAENHANYVWKNLILNKAAAKYIAIIAHSYGGVVAINMCKSFPESFQQRVIAIALTDSCHSLYAQDVPAPLIKYLRKVTRNWVKSPEPLGTPLILDDEREVEHYSAGTKLHEMTSWSCFSRVYEFIDSKYQSCL